MTTKEIQMKNVLLAALAVTALLLSGCGEPVVGEVTDKRSTEERTWTTQEADYDNRCTGTGTKRKCQRVFDGYETVEHREDATWTLVVTDDAGEVHEVRVDQAEFDAHEVGDRFDEERG